MSTPVIAGKLKLFKNAWSQITSDPRILKSITGYTVDFISTPFQFYQPRNIPFSHEEKVAIDNEIVDLVGKKAIREIQSSECLYLSTIFTVTKKSGGLRPIINLKNLNKFVNYEHFKMERFSLIRDLIIQNDFLTTIDLKDAYFSVPIDTSQHGYLSFSWDGKFYCFQCLPFGLSSAPRIFTKIMKPVIASIRERGIRAMIYLDDILILSRSKEESLDNTSFVINLLESLGFTINYIKSCLIPQTTISFLGFIVNSMTMTISVPHEKIERFQSLGKLILDSQNITIRNLARFIGLIVSFFDAFPLGKLHFRMLEIEKTKALQNSNNDFNAHVTLDEHVRSEIQWWLSKSPEEFTSSIQPPPIRVRISTDASKSGWGAFSSDDDSFVQGTWPPKFQDLHINALELVAIQNALLSLCATCVNKHIHVKSDNSTAVSYINRLGGTVPNLNKISTDIWLWCFESNNWLSASHIAGIDNCTADVLSRRDVNKELSLVPSVFQLLLDKFQLKPDIDLFASRFNNKLPKYVSWKPDSCATAVDAFSLSWGNLFPYMFPPFCLLSRVLNKVRKDRTQLAIVIAPVWKTQVWFPLALDLLVAPPILLPEDSVIIPHPQQILKLQLAAWLISANSGTRQEFRNTLQTSSNYPGDQGPINNTNLHGRYGIIGVVNSRLIHTIPL